VKDFKSILAEHSLALNRSTLQTLQINVGRKCNQACRHCHVDAAPWRTEMMDQSTARRLGEWIETHRPAVVDITGGAPELSDHFRYFVETARSVGSRVIDRNNLTIIETDAFRWLPEYLASHRVEVVASLPCYLEENVDGQRGDGVFQKSIAALKKLNAVGYGRELPLHLVYNPQGTKLPPPQAELEADYKVELRERFGIEFSGLFTITNQPIARFAEDLRQRVGLLSGTAGEQLQSGNGGRTDVPDDDQRRLEGRGLRLRLQPDARNAASEWPAAVPLGRDAGVAGRAGDPDGRALSGLHGRQRQQLHRRGGQRWQRPRCDGIEPPL
jgi:radical SAM/Cys-rich protein